MSVRRTPFGWQWCRSYLLSALCHFALLGVTIVGLWWWCPRPSPREAALLETRVAETTFESGWQLRNDLSLEALEAAARDAQQVASPQVDPTTPVLGNFIRDEIQRQRYLAEEAAPDSLLSQLERLGGELEAMSGSASVNAMSQLLQSTLGLPAPNTPLSGNEAISGEAMAEFDHGSAQLDSVTQVVATDGTTTYVARMIDQHGRQMDVELDAETGRELYDTFQLMQRFPLLEQVYRNVIMGLLQQLLEQPHTEPNEDVVP